MTEQHSQKTLEESRAMLSAAVQGLLPDSYTKMYEATNTMHCKLDTPGGSKFTSVSNIFEVIAKDGNRIADAVEKREDDRAALLKSGADPRAFLPATRAPEDPTMLPEALYYKVDGIKGKMGLVQLNALPPETRVLIRREKSHIVDGVEKVPASYTVIRGTFEEMPDTDFATVIVGRSPGETVNAVWTVHPGAPIRPAAKDVIPGTNTLQVPQEGRRQRVIVTIVEKLLQSGMAPEDYVKLIPGDFDAVVSEYEVMKQDL